MNHLKINFTFKQIRWDDVCIRPSRWNWLLLVDEGGECRWWCYVVTDFILSVVRLLTMLSCFKHVYVQRVHQLNIVCNAYDTLIINQILVLDKPDVRSEQQLSQRDLTGTTAWRMGWYLLSPSLHISWFCWFCLDLLHRSNMLWSILF